MSSHPAPVPAGRLRTGARRLMLGALSLSAAATVCLVPVATASAAPAVSITNAAIASPAPATPNATAVAAPTTTTTAPTAGQQPAGQQTTGAPSPTTSAAAPSNAPTSVPAGSPTTGSTVAPTSTVSVPVTAQPTPSAAPAGNALVPAVATSTGTTTGTDAATNTFTLSSAVTSFLSGLNLNLPDGPVTGSLTGSVLTVSVGAPALPFTLPVAGQQVSFNGATLSIDESTKTLTLSASVVATNGLGGTLTVTVAHADTSSLSGTDLSANLAITGISVLGTTVDVAGGLSYSGGKVSASLTGTLDSDAVISDALTIKSGTTVTLATDTGLSVTGSAVIGSGQAAFTVTVKGQISGAKNWSLTVDDTTNTPTFSPVDGLTINPSFTGSITDTDGTVTFDVAGDNTASWMVGTGKLALSHVEVSNGAVPSALSCPGATDGQVWFDISGTYTDDAAGISGTAEACVVPASKSFAITLKTPSITLPNSSLFSINDPKITVTGTNLGSADESVSLTGSATLVVTPDASHTVQLPVSLIFSSDGSFTASVGVNLGALGIGTSDSTGTLVLASQEIKQFDPKTLGFSADPFDLPAGVTVLLNYSPSGAVSDALAKLQLPAATVARASLGPAGFSASISLQFGAQDQGKKLFGADTPGGAAVYVNDISLGFTLGASSGSITVSGSAFVVIPPLYPDARQSQVEVTLGGSLGVTAEGAVSVSISFDIAGVNGPWTDAFGIKDLSVDEVAGKIGIKDSAETAGIPLPTVSFLVKNLTLPDSWGNALGIQPGAQLSLNLALDVDNPIIGISIVGATPNTVALKPFAVAKDVPGGNSVPSSVVDLVQVNTAQLLFAPTGGTDAAGNALNPGANLVFDAQVAGVPAHVDAAVALLPFPSLSAHVNVGGFGVGPVTLSNTYLAIDLDSNPASAEGRLRLPRRLHRQHQRHLVQRHH